MEKSPPDTEKDGRPGADAPEGVVEGGGTAGHTVVEQAVSDDSLSEHHRGGAAVGGSAEAGGEPRLRCVQAGEGCEGDADATADAGGNRGVSGVVDFHTGLGVDGLPAAAAYMGGIRSVLAECTSRGLEPVAMSTMVLVRDDDGRLFYMVRQERDNDLGIPDSMIMSYAARQMWEWAGSIDTESEG